MTALESLCQMIPPPREPVGVSGDWEIAEDQLGLQLPADFKKFVSTYGSGRFGMDEILVAQPLEWTDVRKRWTRNAAYFQAVGEVRDVPFSVFPEFRRSYPAR